MLRGNRASGAESKRHLQKGGATLTGLALSLAGIASGLGVWAVLERLDHMAEAPQASFRAPESLAHLDDQLIAPASQAISRRSQRPVVTPVVAADTWMLTEVEPVIERPLRLSGSEVGHPSEREALSQWKGTAANRWIATAQLPAVPTDWDVEGWADLGGWPGSDGQVRRAFRSDSAKRPGWAWARTSRPQAGWAPLDLESVVEGIDFRPPRGQADGELTLLVNPRWRDYDLAVVWSGRSVVTPADLISARAEIAESSHLRLQFSLDPAVARAGAPRFLLFARARDKWRLQLPAGR